MDFPILSLMVIIPLIGALATLFMGGSRAPKAKYVAAIFSLVSLVMAVYLLTIKSCDLADLTENYVWFKAAGIQMNIIFQIDGLSILMVFLTALLVFLVVLFSWHEETNANYYHALLLAMEVGLMGVYMAADYFLFYIMWEGLLLADRSGVRQLRIRSGHNWINDERGNADLRLRTALLRIRSQDARTSLPHMASRRTRRGTYRRIRPSGRSHA